MPAATIRPSAMNLSPTCRAPVAPSRAVVTSSRTRSSARAARMMSRQVMSGWARDASKIVLELDDDHFDRVRPVVHVTVDGAGRISGKPVGLTLLPVVRPDLVPLLIDHVEASRRECDDRPAMVVPVQVEWLIGEDDGLPHL